MLLTTGWPQVLAGCTESGSWGHSPGQFARKLGGKEGGSVFKLRPVESDVDLCEMQARQMVIAHEASHTLLRANIPCTGLPQGDTFSAEEFLSHIR